MKHRFVYAHKHTQKLNIEDEVTCFWGEKREAITLYKGTIGHFFKDTSLHSMIYAF